jgi:hypothetical protein
VTDRKEKERDDYIDYRLISTINIKLMATTIIMISSRRFSIATASIRSCSRPPSAATRHHAGVVVSSARTSASSSRAGYASSRSIQNRSSSSSSKPPKDLPPPLPPSSSSTSSSSSSTTTTTQQLNPAKAKQEFLKTTTTPKGSDANADHHPIQKMARLQKELDIVRDRAAERLEQKLQKSVWRRLTDPLRRHSHSWINVGAVLLAYILAHNLYMAGKEKKELQQELDETRLEKETVRGALRDLLQDGTLRELAAACVQELHDDDDGKAAVSSSAGSFWNAKSSSGSNSTQDLIELADAIQTALKNELRQRIGDHTLTNEERRIQEMQKAWEGSQQEIIVKSSSSSSSSSPEQELLLAVLQDDADALEKAVGGGGGGGGDLGETTKKQQRRGFSM